MAASIFTFLDDIAALMDDVAVASKVATQKTAAILGDDLAVNAEKATGYVSSRELPVLWSISKGSFINKLIIVPLILILNSFAPLMIKILLVVGGIYLAYEGAEKIVSFIFHKKKQPESNQSASIDESSKEEENKKIWAAIKTDFILSLEIVIIALSTVLNKSLSIQIITVSIVAFIATVGVYGLVAILVRMDDVGFKIIQASNKKNWVYKLGKSLVKALPLIVRLLSILGTIALILVSGGIFIHYVDVFHNILPKTPTIIREIIFGLSIGIIAVILIEGIKKVYLKILKKQSQQ